MANAYSLSAGPRTATLRPPGRKSMAAIQATPFNPQTFLAQVGDSRTILQCQKHQILFAQGDTANAVFYVQAGRVKLSVVSQQGKEAVVAMLERGNFFGKGASPDSWCVWPRRPPWTTPVSCALTNRR